MKFGKMIFLTLIFFTTVGVFSANAQMREVTIPNTGMFNSIRDFIQDDLAANGEETVNNTKYLLQRGEIYTHTESYDATHKVWLEAEAGDGPRPVIQAISLGEEAPRLSRSTDDQHFISLRYEGRDQLGAHTDNAPYRQRGDSTTCTVIDNIAVDHRHDVCRADANYQKWYVYDNIFAHVYQQDSWWDGKPFRFRNSPVDSIVIKDNTFFMSFTYITFNETYGGIKYFEFSQNTVYALGGLLRDDDYGELRESASLNFGTAQNIICKDNLFQNVGVWGYPPQFADSIYVVNVDLTDSTETIDFSYNNFWRDPEFLALNPEDVSEVIELFDPELQGLLGEGIISEQVTFNNVPPQDRLKEALSFYWDNPSTAITTYFRLDSIPAVENVNFGYTANLSATGSSTGGPLGDARWYDGVETSVSDNSPQVAESFSLHGNYPNPFNPATTIQFDLPQAQVKIMNLLGQTVYETPEKSFAAGFGKKINIEAGNWNSGVYFYQVTAKMKNQTAVQTGKMMLLK